MQNCVASYLYKFVQIESFAYINFVRIENFVRKLLNQNTNNKFLRKTFLRKVERNKFQRKTFLRKVETNKRKQKLGPELKNKNFRTKKCQTKKIWTTILWSNKKWWTTIRRNYTTKEKRRKSLRWRPRSPAWLTTRAPAAAPPMPPSILTDAGGWPRWGRADLHPHWRRRSASLGPRALASRHRAAVSLLTEGWGSSAPPCLPQKSPPGARESDPAKAAGSWGVRSSKEKREERGEGMEKERKRLAAGIQRTEGDIIVGMGPTTWIPSCVLECPITM